MVILKLSTCSGFQNSVQDGFISIKKPQNTKPELKQLSYENAMKII